MYSDKVKTDVMMIVPVLTRSRMMSAEPMRGAAAPLALSSRGDSF